MSSTSFVLSTVRASLPIHRVSAARSNPLSSSRYLVPNRIRSSRIPRWERPDSKLCRVSATLSPAEQRTLTPEVCQLVKSTVPFLKKHSTDIVSRFYPMLFERHPELRKQFNMDRQKSGSTKTDGLPSQVVALARSVLAYATNIDKPEVLVPVVVKICHKHVSRAVEPLQYNFVGECLLKAIADELGEDATPQVLDAWKQAYGYLADLFIENERTIYEEAAARAGYTGFKEMIVTRAVDAEDGAKELWVLPEDGKVPDHFAGQFVAVAVSGVADIGDAMVTTFIDQVSATELRLRVPANGERANLFLMSNSPVGAKLAVGMPCGPIMATA